MCLDTHWQKAKVAEQDIICYKIVTRGRGMRRGTYKSYWREYRYSLGGYYHEPRFMPDLETRQSRQLIDGKPVYFCDNGFHSYSKAAGHLLGWNDVLIKCVIPKGVRYYESTAGTEYCAEELQVLAQAARPPLFEFDKVKWITEFN